MSLRVIWQYMDGPVRHQKKYYMDLRSFQQNTTQKTKKMNNNDLTKTPGAREGLAVPASYKISQCYSYNRGVLIDTSILKQTPIIRPYTAISFGPYNICLVTDWSILNGTSLP
jgi:hypothetical protein